MSGSEAEGGIPLLESDVDILTTDASSRKRKRVEEPESKKERKKARRKKQKQKLKAINNEDLDEELSINLAFARMDSQLLADYINQRTRHYGKELSSVELDDRFIPARSILNTSSWTKSRTLDSLPGFLKQFSGKMEPTPKKPTGAPHTLVITASGIRAADAFRALRLGLPKEGIKNPSVAKLFAKHIKLAESIEQCQKYKMDIGVGTPQRISELLDHSALSTANLKRIVVDVSYIDQKKRGVLDMKELHEALIQLLLRKEFTDANMKGKSGLLLFF